jgi:hypothetical protein
VRLGQSGTTKIRSPFATSSSGRNTFRWPTLPRSIPDVVRERTTTRPDFAALDADKDGKLSRAEFTGPPAPFTKLDRDGDGRLSTEEAAAAGR